MEEDSPFAHVPTPGISEPGHPLTYEGQLQNVGALASGLRSRSKGTRIAVRLVVIVPALVLATAAVWTLFTN